MTSPPQIDLAKEFSAQLIVHTNIGPEVVITTVDKVRICLMETRDCLADKREWITPLAVLLALLTTLVAADFRDFVLAKAVWNALYVLGTIVSTIWLMVALHKAYANRRKGSIEGIVNRLKAGGGVDLSSPGSSGTP